MAKHVASGDRVHVLILAEGLTSRSERSDESVHVAALSELRAKAERASEVIGVKTLEWGGYHDNRMDQYDLLDIVKRIERFAAAWRPTCVYTHHAGDMNIDHAITQRAVVTALRPQPTATFCRLLHFEVVSSTEWGSGFFGMPFVPQWYEDVTPYLDAKLRALEAYSSELRPFPHPRSREGVIAQARLRGCCVGVEAAEAFALGWQISRINR